jgi:hypothetical protein
MINLKSQADREVNDKRFLEHWVCLSWKLNQKSRFNLTLMLLIELCEVLYEGSFQVYGMESDEMR